MILAIQGIPGTTKSLLYAPFLKNFLTHVI